MSTELCGGAAAAASARVTDAAGGSVRRHFGCLPRLGRRVCRCRLELDSSLVREPVAAARTLSAARSHLLNCLAGLQRAGLTSGARPCRATVIRA